MTPDSAHWSRSLIGSKLVLRLRGLLANAAGLPSALVRCPSALSPSLAGVASVSTPGNETSRNLIASELSSSAWYSPESSTDSVSVGRNSTCARVENWLASSMSLPVSSLTP
jgi:hypothetical protein